jgi:uncharacterized membrane protein
MPMILLTAGVTLWWVAHLFKRLAPGPRAVAGERGKGVIAVLILASVVLMVLGYRAANYVPVWDPPQGLRHLNNLLMVVAFYLYAASGMKTAVARWLRHPQLTGFSVWAVAHLIAPGNGDVASVILFGGLLVWAILSMILINRAVPRPAPPPKAPVGKEIGAVVGAVLVTGIVGAIHGWIGPNPFG